MRASDWLVFHLSGHGVADARGMAIARVFDADGRHVATVAQEGLVRSAIRSARSAGSLGRSAVRR